MSAMQEEMDSLHENHKYEITEFFEREEGTSEQVGIQIESEPVGRFNTRQNRELTKERGETIE